MALRFVLLFEAALLICLLAAGFAALYYQPFHERAVFLDARFGIGYPSALSFAFEEGRSTCMILNQKF